MVTDEEILNKVMSIILFVRPCNANPFHKEYKYNNIHKFYSMLLVIIILDNIIVIVHLTGRQS